MTLAQNGHGPESCASHSRLSLLRWQVGYGTFGVPQAAAPIVFALVALPITGTAKSGASLVFAMTSAQVLGAVPVSRLGLRFNSVFYLRALVAVRTLALAVVTILAAKTVSFSVLLVMVVTAGAVNGAAHGYQRSLLNYLVEPRGVPRALGVAATLNELTFATSPVLASLLGTISPASAMAAITVLGAGPMILMPTITEARWSRANQTDSPTRIARQALLWLFCATASGTAAATVEVGAVSLALTYGLDPGGAFVFALVLCIGSVTGGIWVSLRNRIPTLSRVIAFLTATTIGSGLILMGRHMAITLTGAAIIGLFLPMLSTFYSLALDELAPPERRAEVFAFLRTASSLSVIAVSGLLALLGLHAALIGSLALLLTALTLTTTHHASSRRA